MIQGRFIWILSAILGAVILAVLSYNERSVDLSPSYQTSTMENLYLKQREGDGVKWELSSDEAVIPEGQKEIHLRTLALKINQTPEIYLTSGGGTYHINKGNIMLNETVQLNIRDATFHTETLHWRSKDEMIHTDDDVRFTGNSFLITGSGLLASVDKQQVRIMKDVKATFYR